MPNFYNISVKILDDGRIAHTSKDVQFRNISRFTVNRYTVYT